MSRILIAWELGGNYGHLTRCLRIAIALRERGHKVAFIVKDTRTAAELLGKAGFAYFQAPRAVKPTQLSRPPANFAEILIGTGYADQWGLLGMTQAWLGLYQLYRPNVILADHAPTALFAARIANIPAVPIGNGFSIPPAIFPQPSLRPWENIASERLVHADNTVNICLAAVHKTLDRASRPAPTLATLYGDSPLLDCFPEFDQFGVRENANYIGPILFNAAQRSEQWREIKRGEERHRVLVYLHSQIGGFAALMQFLKSSEYETIAVVPDLRADQIKTMSSPQLTIHNQLIDFGSLLPGASVVVNYGSAATMAASLLKGVPMLLLPQYVEQYHSTHRVNELGASVVMDPDRTENKIAAAIAQLTEDLEAKKRAKAFARKYVKFESRAAVSAAVDALETAR